MTTRNGLTAYLVLLVVLPVVMSLAAGMDPMAGYRGLAGMMVAAGGIGLEIRR